MTRFRCPALRRHPHGANLARILSAALDAVHPAAALRRCLQREDDWLLLDGQGLDLRRYRRIRALALGKAAPALAAELETQLGDRLERGLLIAKHPAPPPGPRWQALTGGHPLPDDRSLAAGRAAARLVDDLTADDLFLCLISGGGSALMSLPRLPLAQWQALHRALLASGAPIQDINTLRRRLDALKGGGLAQRAAPARVISLVLSDVIGNPLEAIASGPTFPDPTDRAQALQVLEAWLPPGQLQESVRQALLSAPEAAARPQAAHYLIGDNRAALQAAAAQAAALGYHTVDLGSRWQGEARQVGAALVQRLAQAQGPLPLLLLAGGETTVTLEGTVGLGGRNQELALAAVRPLAALPNAALLTLATDGEDGPTQAAGALVASGTLAAARQRGLNPEDFLARHDAWHFFQPLGALLRPGPTGTNVNDLVFLLRE